MRFCLALLLLAPLTLPAQDLVAKTDAKSPEDERKSFKLPVGFEAQLVASEPDIQKPMQIAFDDKGRLWVTTSRHYPWAAENGKGTDKLFVLSDFDKNGKAKTVKVFDDKLNIPIGVLPLEGGKSVIVSECGKIMKLTDTDGDDTADERIVLYQGFGFKDTHGMTNSFTAMPDGWIYACHGFSNDSEAKGGDGNVVKMNSGHTFRFKADGSRIEVFTRGQVNPFGICVDPWGNLYTADCHSKPITQLIRGAYYDSFGKPHDGLGYAPHVFDHLHDSTGLCGLTYYSANQFPKEWHDVMFLGNVVTSRINADKIAWHGSTPTGKALPDFLVSSDPWFRPVDIKTGPDGAIYVSDFYNKIIGHYEVDLKHPGRDRDRGRLWRIAYTGKPHTDKFESPKELAELKPLRELAAKKELTETDRKVLLEALKKDARLARAAVDAMVAHPHEAFAEPLLEFAVGIDAKDTHLKHAAKIALRDSAMANDVIWQKLVVAAKLDKKGDKLKVFFDIVLANPDRKNLRVYYKDFLTLPITTLQRKRLAELVARLDPLGFNGLAGEIESVISSSSRDATEAHIDLLRSSIRNFPPTVRTERQCPADDDIYDCLLLILQGDIKSLKLPAAQLCIEAAPHTSYDAGARIAKRLRDELAQQKEEPAVREAIIESLTWFTKCPSQQQLASFLTRELVDDSSLSFGFRARMYAKLAGELSSSDQIAISGLMKSAPYSACLSIAQALATDAFGADLLLAAVKKGEAPARLLQEKEILERLKKTKVNRLDERLKELTKDIPAPEKRLDDLLKARTTGYPKAKTDPAIGKQLFAKNCANCHQLGGEGAKVGPQLDGIGIRGLERLLEDTLDPNRNVDHAFRQTRLDLKDGTSLSGLLRSEEGDTYVTIDSSGKEVRTAKADVDKKATLAASAMPANVDTLLSEAEYYHLMSYLLTQKPKK